MKKKKNFDKNYIFIFLVSIFLLFPLINNLYFYGHDTTYHVATILSLIKNTNYNLKILPIIANDFGYGSGIFYPQLFHITTVIIYKLFKPFSISIFSSIKITNFVTIFLSGIFMYQLMKKFTKNNNLSFVSALLYMTAPYKLYDYIIRDAQAESLVFVFLPLIFISMYYIINKEYKKFYISFIIGYVGLINSHLVMTMYITIFLGIILLIQRKRILNKNTIKYLFLATGIVLLICLPFIIPLVEHKIYGSYVVFKKGTMATPIGVQKSGLNLYKYILGCDEKFIFPFINYMSIILIVYLFIKYKSPKKIINKMKNDFLFTTGIICTILGLWMSTSLFPWTILPQFLLMIQFPYRLGILITFGISILCYYALNKIKIGKRFIIILSIIFCVIMSIFCLRVQNYQHIILKNINISNDGMGWQNEYLPIKTKEKFDYFMTRSNKIIIKSGTANVVIIKNKTPYLKFKVETDNIVTLELPRIYYFGYNIYNNHEKIPYYENENGFIEIKLNKNSVIEMKYTGTTIDKIAIFLSFLTIIVSTIILIFKK